MGGERPDKMNSSHENSEFQTQKNIISTISGSLFGADRNYGFGEFEFIVLTPVFSKKYREEQKCGRVRGHCVCTDV